MRKQLSGKLGTKVALVFVIALTATGLAACAPNAQGGNAQGSDATSLLAVPDHKSALEAGGDFSNEKCITCHGDFAEMTEDTPQLFEELGYNPHESHYGEELDCVTCHSESGQSEVYCTTCHKGFSVPEGWTAKPME